MTEKQYLREIDKINKMYDKIFKDWGRFHDSTMMIAIQNEKNEKLLKITEFYHSQ